MKQIAILYGSMTGNTEQAADLIKEKFGNELFLENIDNIDPGIIHNFDIIIFGISTWNVGQLEPSWEEFFPVLDEIDFNGKLVAIFGLGDQINYGDTFVDAMGLLYDKLKERGAKIIGKTDPEGYYFQESLAHRNGNFVGLVLDEDNQPELTEQRIENWVLQLKNEIKELEQSIITQ